MAHLVKKCVHHDGKDHCNVVPSRSSNRCFEIVMNPPLCFSDFSSSFHIVQVGAPVCCCQWKSDNYPKTCSTLLLNLDLWKADREPYWHSDCGWTSACEHVLVWMLPLDGTCLGTCRVGDIHSVWTYCWFSQPIFSDSGVSSGPAFTATPPLRHHYPITGSSSITVPSVGEH